MEKNLSSTIIEYFGLENFEPTSQQDLVKRISQIVMKGLMMKIARVLSPDQSTKLADLTKTGGAPEVIGFLEQEIPTFPNMITEELGSIKSDMEMLKKA